VIGDGTSGRGGRRERGGGEGGEQHSASASETATTRKQQTNSTCSSSATTVTGSKRAIARTTPANAAAAGPPPSRQTSGRRGHATQQPSCGSYSAGMRKATSRGEAEGRRLPLGRAIVHATVDDRRVSAEVVLLFGFCCGGRPRAARRRSRARRMVLVIRGIEGAFCSGGGARVRVVEEDDAPRVTRELSREERRRRNARARARHPPAAKARFERKSSRARALSHLHHPCSIQPSPPTSSLSLDPHERTRAALAVSHAPPTPPRLRHGSSSLARRSL
jgi:hypothetical protein